MAESGDAVHSSGELLPGGPWSGEEFTPFLGQAIEPATPLTRLEEVRDWAYKSGIRYAYIGNVPGHGGESTYCPKCHAMLVRHVGYERINYVALNPKTGKCVKCRLEIPGVWT